MVFKFMAFTKGHNKSHGGARKGAGRDPDWLKEQTREIIRKDKLVERLAQIARGDNIEQPLNNGEVVPIPAPVSEQRKAILDLLERGFGKVAQGLEHSGEIAGQSRLVFVFDGDNNDKEKQS